MPRLLLSSLALFLCLTLTIKTAYSEQKTISTGADLKALADEVSKQNNHLGTTVVLANDIDMSGITDFTGIGRYDKNVANVNFRGVFDGNGYAIKNMKITISTTYAGLFGYTVGSTIKNVVIDSSCSVTSTFDDSGLAGFAGGIIGYADAGTGVGETRIQNCVNMGTVTSFGNNSKTGGIAGLVYATRSQTTVVNCVNLGKITYSGLTEYFMIGGIAGRIGTYDTVASIRNCVNLGTVTAPTSSADIGAIVGYSADSKDVVQNCYWLSGTAPKAFNGLGSASNILVFNSEYNFESGGSLVTSLNNYVISQDSSLGMRKWGTAAFNTSEGSPVNPKLIMWIVLGTPDTPTKEGHSFDEWYIDSGFNTKWNALTHFAEGDATLYAKWKVNQYTVTFDSDGGSAVPSVTQDYGTSIGLSTPAKEGHTFDGWKDASGAVYKDTYTIKGHATLTAQWKVNQYTVTFDSNGGSTVPSVTKDYETTVTLSTPTREGHTFNYWYDSNGNVYTGTYTIKKDVTLTAQWTANNYTVTFDVNGGEDLDEPSKTVTYGEKYGELPEPINLGHHFLGWFTSNVSGEGELITNETAVDISDNHTLYALWDVNNYTVTFDFGNGTVIEELFYYGDIITCPDSPEREGYTFVEWNNTHDRMPAEDITIKAIWSEIPKEFVKIEFTKKDMTEDEIIKIIYKYAGNDNYVIKIVESESGGTAVVVKFSDVNNAKNFVENIKESGDVNIKSIRYIDEPPSSFSNNISFLFSVWGLLLFVLFK